MIERGAPWGEPVAEGTPRIVTGTDADLARALAASTPGELLAFRPGEPTDLGRALGSAGHGRVSAGGWALPVDLLEVAGIGPAANALVVGAVPARLRAASRSFEVTVECDGRTVVEARAQSVVVANGQFVDGADTVPRGHPGDGWLEVQVYDVPRGQRRELRRRIVTGAHLPHPGIVQRRARQVTVQTGRPVPVSLDGAPVGESTRLSVTVWAAAGRVVV